MARQRFVTAFCLLILSNVFVSGVHTATNFTIVNECDYEVWPGIVSSGNATFSTTGFALQRGETKNITAPASWMGRFWGRTQCSHNDSTGNFSCLTGDCGSGEIECSGRLYVTPATIAEFSLDQLNNGVDYFDVSLVDGFNIPILVVPQGTTGRNCNKSGCVVDLNDSCPWELQVSSADNGGDVVGCRSACDAFGNSVYCCNGTYWLPRTCQASLYSEFFETNCPQAYTYAYDDSTNTFICDKTDYTITFCPPNTSLTVPTTSTSPSSSPSRSPSPSPLFVQLPKSPPPPGRSKESVRTKLIFGVIGPLVAGLILTLILIFVLIRKRRSLKRQGQKKTVDDVELSINFATNLPTRFKYEDLRAATKDFGKRIGRGGFGSVFEGTLDNGTKIAVKRLDRLGQGRKEFLAEVQTIGSIHHVNLVRLMGFCIENSNRILVYENMSNGSLDKWIFNKDSSRTLKWDVRKKIILDVVRGLAYLHEECQMRIAHLDVKPENVLLDGNFNAKLSDFGLARSIDRSQSHVITQMRGTRGYLAPEWFSGRITEKVDAYSFGVVMLEVVCGRRNMDFSQADEDDYLLLPKLRAKAEQNQLLDMVDNSIEDVQLNAEEVIKMMRIAIWCLQSDYQKRPSMYMVLKVLEGLMTMEPISDYNFLTSTVVEAPANVVVVPSSIRSASVLSGPR